MVVVVNTSHNMADSVAAATMAAANLASRAGANHSSLGKPMVEKPKEEDKDTDKPLYPRLFNKIVLTLENSLIPKEKLGGTPSHQDGLDEETEKDLRILGCELIQTAGILLKLPQVAMATGQVLFQRFFYSKSFVRHNMETVAMSCLCLASKIEEAPRRIRDVINVFHHIKQVRAQKEIMPMILDQFYTNLKTQVIKAERRVLKELGFCVHVKHPHKLIVMYLQVLKYESHQKLMQMSWNFMNDSLRTDVFMRYNPETIACACIYLSARKLGIPLPKRPQWFSIFRVHESDIVDICYRVMELYVRAKPNIEKLDAAVDELKKKYMESRNKTKEQNISPAVTTVDRNDASHNAWGGFIQRAVPLPLPEKSPAERRSHSRSRTRSRSNSRSRSHSHSRSRSITPRGRKKMHRRSRSRSNSPGHKTKKKSRRYSDSSLSPSQSKHHRRKASRERERERDRDRDRDRDRERDRDRDRERERNRDRYEYSSHQSNKHHRPYNSHRNSHTSRGSHKHYERDRSRDRKR